MADGGNGEYSEAALVVKRVSPSDLPNNDSMPTGSVQQGRPKKRIRSKRAVDALPAEQIHADRQGLSEIVAIATWKAEEHRAAIELRQPDKCKGLHNFEEHPAAYPEGTRTRVAALWSWQCSEADTKGNNVKHTQIKFVDMHHLLHHRRSFPVPDVLENLKLLELLEEAASKQASKDGAALPCVYLGAFKGLSSEQSDEWTVPRSDFEKDPAKFPAHVKPDGRTSHAEVWYEWEHIKRPGQDGKLYPHRVCIRADDIVVNKRKVPHDPFSRLAPPKLHFDVSFMQKVAALKDTGIEYRGMALVGSKSDFFLGVPDGGVDIQDTPVYWTLPGGKYVCYSVRKLIGLQQYELHEKMDRSMYYTVADVMGFCFLGMLDRDVVEDFKLSPGTLGGKEYTELAKRFAKKPANEMSPCWWAVVTGDLDQPPRLLCRSLAVLLLELEQHRVATPAKLIEELSNRRGQNSKAINALLEYPELWHESGGPPLSKMAECKDVSEALQQEVSDAAKRLEAGFANGRLKGHVALARLTEDDKQETIRRLCDAAGSLRCTSWEAMRLERFNCTLDGCWDATIAAAQSRLGHANQRCKDDDDDLEDEDPESLAGLAIATDDDDADIDDAEKSPPVRADIEDADTVDPDEFKCWKRWSSGNKPHGWTTAVRRASMVHVSYIRFLLELHYDNVHAERPGRKQKRRSDDQNVQAGRRTGTGVKLAGRLIQNHKHQRHGTLALPWSIRTILQRPGDEKNWQKMDEVRRATINLAQGRECVVLAEEENIVKDIVDALLLEVPDGLDGSRGVLPCAIYRQSDRRKFHFIPAGAKLDIPAPSENERMQQQDECTERQAKRQHYIDQVKAIAESKTDNNLWFCTRPFGTSLEPPLAAESKALVKIKKGGLQQFAENKSLSQQDIFSHIALFLWDTLFFNECVEWTNHGHANLDAPRTKMLADAFMKGQRTSETPLADGICAFCGALLHGTLKENGSNKEAGKPVDHNAKELEGADAVNAQPPFLLRYSPKLIAEEVQEVFKHDPETNRLSLQDESFRPWIRTMDDRVRGKASKENTWLYCKGCHATRLSKKSSRNNWIAFRDKAAQHNLKPEDPYRMGPAGRTRASADGNDAEPGVAESDDEANSGPPTAAPEGGAESSSAAGACPSAAAKFLTIQDYQQKWRLERKRHLTGPGGNFDVTNLVPQPKEQLMQDVPWVPFHRLLSIEAQTRLSIVKPMGVVQEAGRVNGVPTFPMKSGHVGRCVRHGNRDIEATLAFMLNKSDGQFTGLSIEELRAWHECLCWLRSDGENKVFAKYWTSYERFNKLWSKVTGELVSRSLLPEGDRRAEIRFAAKAGPGVPTATLADTLGEESTGLVVVATDHKGAPASMTQVKNLAKVVGTQGVRIDIRKPTKRKSGWRWNKRWDTAADDVNDAFDKDMIQDLANEARDYATATYVEANDRHLDAKYYPVAHPHGTGSCYSEPETGGIQHFVINRLALLQSWFRKSATWVFQQYDRMITNGLYNKERYRMKHGRGSVKPGETDNYRRIYGTTNLQDLPESVAWWSRQAKNLYAMCDDSELGMFGTMTTVTHCDSSPEMLAAMRRGPLAKPTEQEMVEYLLPAKNKSKYDSAAFEEYAYEHVLCHSRRVAKLKANYLSRGKATCRGIVLDYFDRTEEQQRKTLHDHIVEWWQPRQQQPYHVPISQVRREVPGHDCQQRSMNCEPSVVEGKQEDELYHAYHVARIWAELVRPNVSNKSGGPAWNGYDTAQLRIAGLCRAIQIKNYIHQCSQRYCLAGGPNCRFFFPWPLQPQQQFDENTERLALKRGHTEDQWVVSHDLEMAMSSPGQVNVTGFDPNRNCDASKRYVSKYNTKPEKHFHMEIEMGPEDAARKFLTCRTVGEPLAMFKLLGQRVVRNTRPVVEIISQFIFKSRPARQDPAGTSETPAKPPMGMFQRYALRNQALHHLRIGQYKRYFRDGEEEAVRETLEEAQGDEDKTCESAAQDSCHHKHFDAMASATKPGTRFRSESDDCGTMASRRSNSSLAVTRTKNFSPSGMQREMYYEQKFALGLPWFCPNAGPDEAGNWTFRTCPPLPSNTAGNIRIDPYEFVDGQQSLVNYECMCRDLEGQYKEQLGCECCAKLEVDPKIKCLSCQHALGFHECDQQPKGLRWRGGTLFGGSFDVERTIMGWSQKGVAIENLEAKLKEFVNAPRIIVADAAEDKLNGGYSSVGIANGRDKYTNDNNAALVFGNGRWELRLHDDDDYDEASEIVYKRNDDGKSGTTPPTGQWFCDANVKCCTVKLEHGPLITREKADQLLKHIESERRMKREANPTANEEHREVAPAGTQLSMEQLQERLTEMENNMNKSKQKGVDSDQWRVYKRVTKQLKDGKWLREIIQASAGTGKSYLLKAICIWCLLHKIPFKAAAPTGIAAANLEVEGTAVVATTIHTLFGLGFDPQKSRLEWAKGQDDPEVDALLRMQLLLLDEASMLDDEFWKCIAQLMETAQQYRNISAFHKRPLNTAIAPDALGQVHVLIFMDVKQLPPATCRPAFLALPEIHKMFRFSTLRENRRVIDGGAERQKQIEEYHTVLDHLSMCKETNEVRKFCVEAYGRGALATADTTQFEGSTSVFSKRRYRDRWNRIVVHRLAKHSKKSLKVCSKCKPKHGGNNQWHPNLTFQRIKRCQKPKSLWTLHLAGDWAYDEKRDRHLMRVMLLANIDVERGFANGKLGRLMSWNPMSFTKRKKCFVDYPGYVWAKFVKETSLRKVQHISKVDTDEIQPHGENLKGKYAESTLVQLPIIPAYAAVLHKVQALTLQNVVRLCLEGIFAHGSFYVGASRSTDPDNFQLIGLPPLDLLDAVAAKWLELNLDVNECMSAAVRVTDEWTYTSLPNGRSMAAATNVACRLHRKRIAQRTIPIVHRTLEQILDPQPDMSECMSRVLEWVERENDCLNRGEDAPPFETIDGAEIFPTDPDNTWWLTPLQKRLSPEEVKRRSENLMQDGDGQASSDEGPNDDLDDEDRACSEKSFSDSESSGTSAADAMADTAVQLGSRARRADNAPLGFWDEMADSSVQSSAVRHDACLQEDGQPVSLDEDARRTMQPGHGLAKQPDDEQVVGLEVCASGKASARPTSPPIPAQLQPATMPITNHGVDASVNGIKPRAFVNAVSGPRGGEGSCWINAALQAIFAPTRFKELLREEWSRIDAYERQRLHPTATRQKRFGNHDMPSLPKTTYQQRLAVTFKSSLEAPLAKPLLPHLLLDAFYIGQQNDASEFLARVLDSAQSPWLARALRGRMAQTLRCCELDCGLERSSQAERFGSLLLPVRLPNDELIHSVQEAVDAYMPVEEVLLREDFCIGCGGARMFKEHSIADFPDVLQLCLNRWGVRGDGARVEALLHPIVVAANLTFKGRLYNLCAVVVHLGDSPKSGHYITIARHTTKNGKWWLYDDANRREARPDEVATTAKYRNFGGMKSYVLLYEVQTAPAVSVTDGTTDGAAGPALSFAEVTVGDDDSGTYRTITEAAKATMSTIDIDDEAQVSLGGASKSDAAESSSSLSSSASSSGVNIDKDVAGAAIVQNYLADRGIAVDLTELDAERLRHIRDQIPIADAEAAKHNIDAAHLILRRAAKGMTMPTTMASLPISPG